MGALLACAVKDLRRQWRDPLALAIWCGVPLLIASLMTLAFGGAGGVAPQARVLVADEDESFLSQLLLGVFDGAGEMFQAESVEREVGLDRMEDGDASALLLVPEGFGQAVLQEEPVTLRLVTNPAQSILPSMVEGMLKVLVDGTFYVQQVLGEPLRTLRDGPPGGSDLFPNATIAALSVQFNQLAKRLIALLDPPLIELETTVESTDSGASRSFVQLLFPGILFMALLFVAQGLSEDIWREREQGTLRRALASAHGAAVLLAGKLLAAAGVITLVCLVGLAFGVVFMDLSPARVPLALGWAVVTGLVLLALFVLMQLYGSTRRGASILTNLLVFPLMMLGGSFFPTEAMPEWLARVGAYTPNGWSLVHFKAILAGSARLDPLLQGLAGMLAAGALLFVLGARRMGGRFASG